MPPPSFRQQQFLYNGDPTTSLYNSDFDDEPETGLAPTPVRSRKFDAGDPETDPVLTTLAAMNPLPREAGNAPLPAPPSRLETDYQDLRTALGQRPQLKQPKWWQRAAGAAAGFGAGWSNAAGRTRRPIDIGEMQENILYPGYRQKLSEWQSRVEPLQTLAGIDQAEAERKRRGDLAEADITLKGAETERAKQQGLAWSRRYNPTWTHSGKGSFNPVTGEFIPDPMAQQSKLEAYQEAKALGATDQQALDAVYGWKPSAEKGSAGTHTLSPGAVLVGPDGKIIANNPRPPHEVDPDVAYDRQVRRQRQEAEDADRVTQSKNTGEEKILKERNHEVNSILQKAGVNTVEEMAGNPDYAPYAAALKNINRHYAPRLQAVQNAYESSIRRRGGEAEHYDVDQDTLNYRVKTPAAADGGNSNVKKLSNGKFIRGTDQDIHNYAKEKGLTVLP